MAAASYSPKTHPTMKKYEPTKREIEVDALKVAIKKTEAAQLRAQETLYRLAAKKERQQAELLLQSMFAKFERKALAPQAT